MEEEKLAKDINILSKDDTEIDVGMIIKALECCKQKGGKDTCKYCYTCPASVWDFEDGITQCYVDLFQKAINLIHRLQGENKRLSLIAGMIDKGVAVEIVNMQETIDMQKAEIELLTEELQEADESIKYSDELLGKRREEISKLKKQVDELKFFEKKYNDLAKKYMADTKTADFIRHRAVKDTAKEILEELYHKNYEIDIKVEDYELHEKAIEIVSKAILKALNERMKSVAERYGVEVE